MFHLIALFCNLSQDKPWFQTEPIMYILIHRSSFENQCQGSQHQFPQLGSQAVLPDSDPLPRPFLPPGMSFPSLHGHILLSFYLFFFFCLFIFLTGVGDGQGGLACCDSWGRKESNTTEWLNWLTDQTPTMSHALLFSVFKTTLASRHYFADGENRQRLRDQHLIKFGFETGLSVALDPGSV